MGAVQLKEDCTYICFNAARQISNTDGLVGVLHRLATQVTWSVLFCAKFMVIWRVMFITMRLDIVYENIGEGRDAGPRPSCTGVH